MRWFSSLSRFASHRRFQFKPRTFRPRIEFLESRWVPTTVTNLNDSGLGSLRYAIDQTANNGTVDFAAGLQGTIPLTSGALIIEKNLKINGPGADKLTVSGGNNSGVFFVGFAQVEISGLTVSQGVATIPPGIYSLLVVATGNPLSNVGGGLANFGGTVTLSDCIVKDNVGSTGGGLRSIGVGIYNWSLPGMMPVIGKVTLNNTEVSGNQTNSSNGSGIFNEYVYDYVNLFKAESEFTINNSRIINNTGTDVNGGGIYNEAKMTIDKSWVNNNVTLVANTPGLGAGIYSSGTLKITQSIIRSNSGPSNGGGIYAAPNSEPEAPTPSLTITNSTIANNRATNSDGGGIWNNGNLVSLNNVTVTGNESARGGGIFLVLGSVPEVALRNTLVAQNFGSASGTDIQGQIQIAFNNLIGIGNGSAGIVDQQNGNIVGDIFNPVNPQLGTLKNNGGPTQTFALKPNSPAIDSGTTISGITTDQRGFDRPVNTAFDIGAFEYQPPNTTTALISSKNPSITTDTVSFTATVVGSAPNSNTPEGNVVFKDNGVIVATIPLTNGQAVWTTNQLTLGTHPIKAEYQGFVAGDYVLNPSSSATLDQVVRAVSTLSLKSYTNPANTGNFIMFAGLVEGLPGLLPTGTVEFFMNGNSIGSAPLETGIACLTFDPFAFDPGTYTITGSYLGDNNYAPTVSVDPLIQVIGATTAALTSNVTQANVPDLITLTVTITKVAPGTQVPTGNVLFFDGGNQIASVALNGSAQAVLQTTFDKGTHSITASYQGDAEFTGSNTTAVNLVIGASVTIVESSPNPSDVNQQVILEAIANPAVGNSPVPTGFVEFYDDGIFLGSAQIIGASAQLPTIFTTVGNHPITAIYTGDTNFTASVSILAVHVVGANVTNLQISPNPSGVNESVTFTATVVPTTGVQTPTGSITFKAGNSTLGTVNLDGNGVAVLVVSNLPAGTYSAFADYSGDGNYAPTRSGLQNVVVNKGVTASALNLTPKTSTFGDLVTFTATVTPTVSGTFVPTGTVTFLDRDQVIGSAPINGGVAVFSTSSLTTGVRYVTARYDGDDNFNVSTSSIVTQLTQAINFFAVGGQPGKVQFFNPDNTLVANFAPFGGFTGAINVAIGDVNGDGYNDLVVAANNGNPDVRVYSGKKLSENPNNPAAALLVQFFAYGLNFNVGANVGVGDVNDDGFADVVTGATVGNPDVRVFSGKDIAQGTFNPNGASLLAQWFPYALQFNVGAKVAVGDVNGDGYADVTTGASAGNPDTRVYNGEDIALGTFNPNGASLLAQWFAYGLNFNVGANVAIGDVNNDGYGDVITGATVGNPAVNVYSGKDIALGNFNPNGASLLSSFFAYDLGFNIGVFVGAADFDGDGDAEIITGASAGAPHYRVVAGNSTGVKPPAIFEGFASGISGGVSVGATSLFLPPV